MAYSPSKKIRASPRLANGMKSFISLKVQGMNLRGTGQYDGFLWNKKEIFTTDYMVAVTFANFSWTVHLDFEQCKAFLLHVFPSKRQLYDETFPKILDVDDDVFVLVNRKEAMEGFLQEVVDTMDFVIYQPLYKFLCSKYEIQPLLKKITRIQAFTRQFLMQSTMEERLLSFFRLDLKELLSRLKGGVKVALIPVCSGAAPGPLHKKVLYLIENPYEMGLSRLCLISYEEFFHTLEVIKANTDRGGLCNPDFVSSLEGVYLSDIAEIRRGMASHNFSVFVDYVEKHNLMQSSGSDVVSSPSSTPNGRSLLSQALADSSSPPPISSVDRSSDIPLQKVRVEECLSIVSFERCLDVQLLDVDEDHSRDWFIDMLSLMSIKSLMASHPPTGNYLERETVLRLRKWRRVKTNSSYAIKSSRCNSRSTSVSSQGGDFAEMTLSSIGGTPAPLSRFPPPNSNLNARRLSEAQLFMEILCESIEIEEERFDEAHRLQLNGTIECNTLWLDPNLMRVYIKPTEEGVVDNTGQANDKPRVTRGINVDDISEVRPGKMSFACDGTPYRTSLCLVGSEGTVCLPVDSVDIRNALLRQFQSFVLAYRTPSGCVTSSSVFSASSKKTENEFPLTPTRAKPAEKFVSAAVSSRRRSSFKCHYPEALPPANSGYSRRKSTPAGCDGYGIASQSKSLNADFNDILGEVNALWMRKSETPFSSTDERPNLSTSLPSALEVPSVHQEVTSPPAQNIFKKLFMEVKPSEEDGIDKNDDSQDRELPPPPSSPTMSVESYVSDEDMEGYTRPGDMEDKDANNSDEDMPVPEEEVVEVKSSPIRRASAALFNVVRRNSVRRDSIVSDDGSVKPTGTISEQEKIKESVKQRDEPTTVIVGDLPIDDDDHADSRSASPTHSVESYQSDEEGVQNPGNDDDDDGANMDGNEDGGKKSAIRRASLKMFSLVRRMSSTAMDDDSNSNEMAPDNNVVLDDEKQ